MKRTLLTVILMSLLLSACGTKAKEESKETETTDKIENKMKVIELTKADFLAKVANYETNPDWKYLGDKPALIDFYATWCGPCKAVAPILEELAGEYEGEVYIYKVDTDKEQELASLFGIRSIPSLLFIPMDGEPQMAAGAAPKMELKGAIDNILLKK